MRQAVLDTDILSFIIDQRHSEVSAHARQYYRVFRYFTVSAITVEEVVNSPLMFALSAARVRKRKNAQTSSHWRPDPRRRDPGETRS